MVADNSTFASLSPSDLLFARAQALREGEAQDVCFGLFDSHDCGYSDALQKLAERIASELPDGDPRVLLVGLGLGSLLRTLTRRNLNITATCADAAQHAAVASRSGTKKLLPPNAWEALELPERGYDVIIAHQSLGHSDALVVLGKAYRALADEGRLILVEEFATGKLDCHYHGLQRLEYFPALAERCGFVLESQDDLSQRALPTVEYFDDLLAEHGHKLITELGLAAGVLARVRDANHRIQLAYARHERAFVLLRLRRGAGIRWRISHVDHRDIPAVADLFRRIFQQEMSPALWHWKYGAGRGQGSIAWAGDTIVAHYGGVTRTVLFFGRPERACQVADVMVDPGERGVLTRKGPFFLTAASLAESCSGFASKHLIGFGFPNSRAMRVGVKQGLYADTGRVVEIFWRPDSSRSSRLTRVQRITELKTPDLERIVEPLWHAMSADLKNAVVGIRDTKWLQYRYLSHPHQDYHVLHVTRRFPRKSYGILVLKRDGERCELMDVVAPLTNLARLIREARRITNRWQSNELFSWVAQHHASLFESGGGQLRDIDVAIPAGIWTDGPTSEQLRDVWWITSGDTDFH